MRFKIGQKVRVVKPYSDSDFHDGEIVEIVGISPNAYYGQDCYKAISCENKDKDWWCLCEDEVESIEDKAAPITNGDKIRAMSNLELADLLLNFKASDFCEFCDPSGTCKRRKDDGGCLYFIGKWLNSEAEDN